MTTSPQGQSPHDGAQAPDLGGRPDAPGAKTVGFAASLGLLLVVTTTTIALYTGFLLWRGDPGSDLLNSLPKDCSWVAIAEDPAELRQAAADVANWGVIPGSLKGALNKAAIELLADLDAAREGIDPERGLGLCRYGKGLVFSVGLKPGAKDAIGALQNAAARRVGLEPKGWTPGASAGGFVEYALADKDGQASIALLQSQDRALFVWADAGADASKLLAEVITATQKASMREDIVMRSAIERVGSGALQLAFAPPPLRAIAKSWLAGHLPAELLGHHAEYAGISIRRDVDTRLTHLHLHVGAGQPGVAWLKATLDPTGKLNASNHLDRDATSGGVLRINPNALRKHAAWVLRHPTGRAIAATFKTTVDKALVSLGAHITGHVVWQIGGGPTPWRLAMQLQPGQDAKVTALLAPAVAGAWAHGTVERGWLVLAPGASGAAVAAAKDFHASAGLGPEIAEDRTRLLNENQGFYLGSEDALPGVTAGTVQFEALWIHTGFIAHLTFPSPR